MFYQKLHNRFKGLRIQRALKKILIKEYQGFDLTPFPTSVSFFFPSWGKKSVTEK